MNTMIEKYGGNYIREMRKDVGHAPMRESGTAFRRVFLAQVIPKT